VTRRGAALLAAAVLASSGAAGAAPGPAAEPPARWSYPRGGRDPLVPPPALYAGQDLPALEVTLIGVDSHRPREPLAVVRLDSRPPLRKVVRPGDRVGEYRILQIRPRSLRVAVPGLGGWTELDVPLRDSTLSLP
jgi:hypothetical protein